MAEPGVRKPPRISFAMHRAASPRCLGTNAQAVVGFVRATSDLALNANLWNLAARPGPDQSDLYAVLVHRALHILRRDLPGCSLSVSAPASALEALRTNGFVIDPNGIRAMGLRPN